MSMQDPVADMLTIIRNAQAMGIQKVHMPHSNLKREILRVLKEEGFIEDFEVVASGNKKNIQVALKYYQGSPVIEKIVRISRPALRIYKGYDQLPQVRGGLGISIISTPKGVMSDKTARAQQVGGEVLCTVE
ncbi:30S ribosomal protein S8 [Aquicella lusitana]|uniref:Small ribosomal subunit protein uS8 n=1 Tax=Aquicella lusitana TaxID=254246 RepID=A0A370GYN5_9COXI|nr:30S ribosomal protein S8 [Aquicella lusitana]RDI46963.1 SSU ribosomal protein S8P [Aquicella lusitana]VVC73853.1 30S ribosomal protein S8 [Aquicella lusitana]